MITPELTDVGAILRARTRSDETGSETGTFSDSTRPTAEEVGELIERAEAEIIVRCPEELETLGKRLTDFARHLVALRTAMMVELSLFPDQAQETDSTYVRLKELFDEQWKEFLRSLEDAGKQNGAGGRMVCATFVSPYSGD